MFFFFSLSVWGEDMLVSGCAFVCKYTWRWMVRINPQCSFTLLKLQDLPDKSRAYDVALITSLLALEISYTYFLRYRKAVITHLAFR